MRQQTKSGIRWATLAACAAVALTIAGCGGGGGSNPPAPDDGGNSAAPPDSGGGGGGGSNPPAATNSSAEGMWQWVFPGGSGFDRIIVLDDGSFWATYGDLSQYYSDVTDPNMTYMINGVERGSFSVTGNRYMASGTDIPFGYEQDITSLSASGTVSAKDTLTIDNNAFETLSYDASYDQPVTVASLAGNYISTHIGSGYPYLTNDAPGTVTITAGGTLTLGGDVAGCAASGTIAQHQTPRGPVGVFDIKLTFSGATCPLGNGTAGTGIAYLTDAGAFLEAIGFTADSTKAFAFRSHRAQ